MNKNLKKLKEKSIKDFEKNLENNIETIYGNQNGENTDFSKIHKKKRSWIKKILIIQFIAFIFLFAILASILYLSSNSKANSSSINIEFEMPKDISSGDQTQFVLVYKNKERITLRDVELVLHYPKGFEFLASEPMPSNQYNDIWKIGDLVRGEEGRIVLKAKVVGEVGNLVTLNASLSYTPENFSSPFKKLFTSPTSQITASILLINIGGPLQVIPNQKVSYAIHYKNASDADLINIKIEAQYPEGFRLDSSNPQVTQIPTLNASEITNKDAKVNNVWIFPILRKGEEGDISLDGEYKNMEIDASMFLVRIGIISDMDQFLAYNEKKLDIEIINPGLTLDLTVNASKEDSSANFSDALNYSIIFKNLGKKNLYNIVISAKVDSDVIDWDTLIDKNFGRREKNIIYWESSSVPELALLKPLDEGVISFSIKIKDLQKINLQKDDLKTLAMSEAIISKIDELNTQVKVSSKTITSAINSDLELRVQGRYFNDDNIAVGQGQLPPEVNQKTTFRIYWNLSNNLHEVSDAQIKTILSSDARWEDKFSNTYGQLVYDSYEHTVIWKIPKILPNKTFEDFEAWFDVSITPKEDMVGKLMLLTSDTSLTAKDNVTRSGISHLSRSVTTNLEDDPFGGGRGLVVGSFQ